MKCFYHGCDLDGHCSGAIVKYRYPECEMFPINYGDPFPWDKISKGEAIYMVDFCLQPEEQMESLANNFDLIWIDHHISAIKAVYGNRLFPHGLRDVDKAACELTWKYIFPDKPMPLAVELLGLYDSWRFQGHPKEPMVLPFQMRMRMEDLDPKNWDGLVADKWKTLFDDKAFLYLSNKIEEGKLILRYDEEQKRRYILTYGFETWIHDPDNGDTLAIAVNLGHTNSKVFDSVWRKPCPECGGRGEVLDSTPTVEDGVITNGPMLPCTECHTTGYIEPYDLMITFCRRKDKLWNVSLYSTKDDVDCGAIAKSFGGGGHNGAAGFQARELPFEY